MLDITCRYCEETTHVTTAETLAEFDLVEVKNPVWPQKLSTISGRCCHCRKEKAA